MRIVEYEAWRRREAESQAALGLDESKLVTCSECGCRSPLAEQFRKSMRKRYCPTCFIRKSGNPLKALFWAAGWGVLVSIWASGMAGRFLWAPAANITLLIPMLWLTICLHEAIHTLTAWLLGGRVYELTLGVGRILYSVRWRGVRFSLRESMLFGMSIATFPNRRYLRLRWLIYIAAPILCHALIVIWLYPYMDGRRVLFEIAPLEALVWVNAIGVVFNLFPMQFNAMFATDGYHLWKLLRGQRSADELHAMDFAIQAFYAYEYEDFPVMLATAEQGLSLYPNNETLRNLHAAALLSLDHYGEALSCFEQALAEPSLTTPSANRAMFLSNRALAVYHLALQPDAIDPVQMASAHASAAEAFFLMPWMSAVRLVRGLSCYFQGYPQVAYDLFEELFDLQEKDSGRASVLAFMALAFHTQGETATARELLADAREFHTKENKILDQIHALIEAPAIDAPWVAGRVHDALYE